MTRCTTRCHSLYHSLSLFVTQCTTRLSFYKQLFLNTYNGFISKINKATEIEEYCLCATLFYVFFTASYTLTQVHIFDLIWLYIYIYIYIYIYKLRVPLFENVKSQFIQKDILFKTSYISVCSKPS